MAFKVSVPEVTKGLTRAARSVGAGLGLVDSERWSREQVQFATAARSAARRALFFVRAMEPDADQTYLDHIRDSARFQLETVTPPPETTWCGSGSQDCEYGGAVGSFPELVKAWDRMLRVTDPKGKANREDVEKLDRGLVSFLARSLPRDYWIRLT